MNVVGISNFSGMRSVILALSPCYWNLSMSSTAFYLSDVCLRLYWMRVSSNPRSRSSANTRVVAHSVSLLGTGNYFSSLLYFGISVDITNNTDRYPRFNYYHPPLSIIYCLGCRLRKNVE